MRKYLLIGTVLIFSIFGYINLQAQTWEKLGGGLWDGLSTGYVKSLEVYNGELYAGGIFTSADGITVSNIAKWDGTNWSDVGGGTNNAVMTMAVYNNELYVGGIFTVAGGIPAVSIAKWNGTNWSNVGNGTGMSNGVLHTGSTGVIALAVYNGELFAGGIFDSINGNLTSSDVAKWNGSVWSDLLQGTAVEITSFAIHNNELYMGAGGLSTMYKWDGVTFSAFGDLNYNGIEVLYDFNGELYSSEQNHTPNSNISYIKKLNGIHWDTVCTMINTTLSPEYVHSFIEYNSQLYVGGSNTSINGNHVGFFFRFDGSDWVTTTPHGSIDAAVNATIIYNSELYVAGAFTYAHNYNTQLRVNNIAKLKPCSAFYTLSPDTIPHNWNGINQSGGIPPISYTWDWGDGSPNSSGAAPSHSYNTAGTYSICLSVSDASGCVESYCQPQALFMNKLVLINVNFTDSTSIPTGITNSSTFEKENWLYPNPTNGQIIVSTNNFFPDKIIIYNSLGKIFIDKIIEPVSNQELTIDLSVLPPGIYFLQQQSGNRISTSKLIVE